MFTSFWNSLANGLWVTRERIKVYSLIILGLSLIGMICLVATSKQGLDYSGKPIGTDFLNVYAAGVILHEEADITRVYDPPYQHSIEKRIMNSADTPYYGWHYPPVFLIVAYLVATAPYLFALGAYLLVGFLALWFAIKPLAPRSPLTFLAFCAFPAMLVNIGHGQNGFLTTALCSAGLFALRKKPWLAGLFFGLMIYKLQFFVVIPALLIAGRYYRAAFYAIAVASLALAASWVLLGTPLWEAFIANTAFTKEIVLEAGNTGWEKIQSVFSLARKSGGSIATAYAAQITVSLLSILACLYVWWKSDSFDRKAAVLCLGSLLATPYLLDYDLMLLAVPIAVLTRKGLHDGFAPYEKSLLALLWAWPLFARSIGTIAAPITPIWLIWLLALCVSETHKQAQQMRSDGKQV